MPRNSKNLKGFQVYLCMSLLPDAQIFIGPRRKQIFAQIFKFCADFGKFFLSSEEHTFYSWKCAFWQILCSILIHSEHKLTTTLHTEAQPIDLLHVQCWLEQNFYSFSEMASLGTLIMLQNVTFDVHVNDKCTKIYVIFTQFTEKAPLRRFLCQSADFWRFGGRKL